VSSFFIAEFSLTVSFFDLYFYINPLKAELNPLCHLLALLGAHHILHVSRIRVNAHQRNKDIIMSSKEMYSILKFYTFISCNYSSVGSPSVVLVKGKLSVEVFEGCHASGSTAMQCGS
jgi:hypothetical protein